jgi:hypothetical protein
MAWSFHTLWTHCGRPLLATPISRNAPAREIEGGASMSLQKWSLLTEIAGSAAVVATLVVLIVQVKENTAAIEATTRESVAARIEQRTMLVATSPQFAELLARSRDADRKGIQPGSGEELQLQQYYASVVTSLEEAYLQSLEGNLSGKFFEARARKAIATLDSPTFRRALPTMQGNYTPEFYDWLRARLGE